MTDQELDTAPTFTIARLDLRAGDVLVVKSPKALNRSQSEGLRAWLEKTVPADCKVLILDDGIDLAVMTAPPQ